MAATCPLTLEAWNGLIERINVLAANPPEGCDALDGLPLVTAPHRWSAADIAAARGKLVEICSNNVFNVPSTGKWLKAIIDELDAAIDDGWCDCQPHEPCCVPGGSQGANAVTQYLYGNITYEAAAAIIGTDAMAHLVECIGGPGGQIIHYTLRHLHWLNCIYQDRWVDTGQIRQVGGQDEYWYQCSNMDSTVVGSGWVPALTPSYQSSESAGSHVYYDQPISMGYHYDYAAARWYETLWIGAFDVDRYVYDLYVSYVCP
jgi:hypothetical protein